MKGIKLFGILLVIISVTGFAVYLGNKPASHQKVVINITSKQFAYIPSQINVTYGSDVTLRITSIDVTHGFQLEAFNIYNVICPAGQTVEVNFVANQRGQFKFFCTVLCGTGHADHLGMLVVS